MRTNVSVKENENISVSDLRYGDYFLSDDACLWVYLEEFTFDNDGNKNTFNAFCFDDSAVNYFSGDTEVRLVKNVNITFSL